MFQKPYFNKKQVEEIFTFFNPGLHTILVYLKEQKKILQNNNLINQDFLQLFSYFSNIQYLEQFFEAKKIATDYFEAFLNKLIILNKEKIADRHIFLPNLISFYEISLLINKLLVISYENNQKNKKILTIDECINEIYKIIYIYIKEVFQIKYAIYYNIEIFKLLKEIKKTKNYQIIENYIENILLILEEINSNYEQINDIFDDYSKKYWFIYNTLTKISALASFAYFLKEENHYLQKS